MPDVLIPYARKSSGEDPAISRDRQTRSTEQWATLNGVELKPAVWEHGVSGSKSWRDRELGLAIAACERGEAAGIIVEEQSRLSRENQLATAEVWDAFQRAGIRLVCVAEGLDTANGDQELSFAIRAALAREQWKQYARRMAHSKRNAVARGVHISGRVPCGYVRPHRGAVLELDVERAPAVTEAFRLRASGKSYADVTLELNTRFSGGRSGKGSWTKDGVRAMLRNRVYLGEARSGELVCADPELTHPALTDRATFDAVRALDRRRDARQQPTGTSSLLAGLVRCKTCGYGMTAKSQQGGSYVGYVCRGRHATGACSHRAFAMMPALDELVENAVLERVLAVSESIERVRVEADLDELRQQIAVEQSKRVPFEDPEYVQLLGLDAATRALATIAAEITRLESELAKMIVENDHDDALDVREISTLWPSFTNAEKRRVLARMIDSVLVSPSIVKGGPIADRARIVWHTDDDAPIPRPPRNRTKVEAGLA